MIESTVTPAANRAEVIERIRAIYPEIQERFGVTRLAIFGSASRDELGATSDVDVLAVFDGDVAFKRYFGVKEVIEDSLGREVDLATPDMIRTELAETISREMVYVP